MSPEKARLMALIMLSLSFLWFCGGCSGSSKDKVVADEFPFSPPSSEVLDPFEQNRLLGRGINLGNALEAPNEGEWGVTLEEEYFQLIKDAGFDAVRIPIRWSAHASLDSPYTIDQAFLDRVDWAVGQALSRELAVVINIHHYEEIMQEPMQHKQRLLALWEQIAGHYRRYPDELLFEILNEPCYELTSSLWNQFLEEALGVIRGTNPYRTVILGPVNWNNIGFLGSLELPGDDRNIIVAVHYYNPFQFTHQGAEWVEGTEEWLGTKWTGSAEEKQAVIRDFDQAKTWAQSHNRPLFMGEFGAYSKADMDSRALWTDFITRQAEARGMSWAYWEFCSGFGAYDKSNKQWNQQLLEALIPPEE